MNLHVVVISPVWPGTNSGYEIAIASSLRVYSAVFKSIHFVSLAPNNGSNLPVFPNVSWSWCPVILKSKAFRFAGSLLSKYPATVQGFNISKIKKKVLEIIENQIQTEKNLPVVLFEDIPVTVLMDGIHRKFPKIKFYVRSHNVLGEAFDGIKNGSGIISLFWLIEIFRIKRFEKSVLGRSGRFWSITSRDAALYFDLYGIKADGVLSVNFDPKEIPPHQDCNSAKLNMLHLGSADMRKKHGLQLFIEKCLPLLRREYKELKFIIGGRNTESLSNDKQGIIGLGFVDNVETFFALGSIFVNTQLVGSGIKVKSLVAMSYGKILVSTPKGIEGVNGVNNIHYLVAGNHRLMADQITKIIKFPGLADEISTNARDFILKNYTFNEKIVTEFLESLNVHD